MVGGWHSRWVGRLVDRSFGLVDGRKIDWQILIGGWVDRWVDGWKPLSFVLSYLYYEVMV